MKLALFFKKKNLPGFNRFPCGKKNSVSGKRVHMMKIKLFIAIIIVGLGQVILSAAAPDIMDVAIFPVFTGDIQHDEILKNCEYMAGEAFSSSGRFYPVPYGRSVESLKKSDGRDRLDLYRKAAATSGAELLCVLELSAENSLFKLSIKIEPVDGVLSDLESSRAVTARIPANVAARGALEILQMMKGVKLKCRITADINGVYTVNAGQWHGLVPGRYRTSAGDAEVVSVDRFSSSVKGITAKAGDLIEFSIYPDVERIAEKLKREIDENTSRFYGTDSALNKRMGSAKESIIGTCVVNQGASFCLPGYGSFLSMEYMGIENGDPDFAGVFATAGLTVLHFTLPSMMNSFDINFFPWVMDRDKSNGDRRLQYFLWGTLPLTFSVSFYNQLAYQYQRKSLLPPLFDDHDATAAAVSVFIPGGGMFYKGYRLAGWSFYLAEMSMGGYAVYEWDNTRGKIAAGGLLLLKAAEVAVSYAVAPSYSVYRNEVSSNYPDFSIGINRDGTGSEQVLLSASIFF